MGLISDLLGAVAGKKAGPRSIADVEIALSRLAGERSAAREGVADAMRERDALLLVDESDKRIGDLDAAADRHRLTLERCDKAEPILLSELADLRTAAKQARWRELRQQYDDSSLDYAKAFRVTVEKMGALMNLHDAARREGYEHETAAAFTPPARMISTDALNQYEAAIERAREMARPAPAPAPKPQQPQPKPPTLAPKLAKPKPPPPLAPPPKPFSPPEPDASGRVAIVILKSGIELEGMRRPLAGETVLVHAEQAKAIVRSGSADYSRAAL